MKNSTGIRNHKCGTVVIICQIVGFAAILLINLFNEYFDIPHSVFGQPATPVNYAEMIIETVPMVLFAVATIIISCKMVGKIKELESIIPVCCNCKKVRLPGASPRLRESWIPMEEYLESQAQSMVTHGLCPQCKDELFPGKKAQKPSGIIG